NPRVVVERLVDGQWQPFADQTGEVQARVHWPQGVEGVAMTYAGQQEWQWSANFEAYEAFPARLGSTPAGSYRFAVAGCINSELQAGAMERVTAFLVGLLPQALAELAGLAPDACPSGASAYAFTSEPFAVEAAAELVTGVELDAGGDLTIQVSPRSIPQTYASVFPYVNAGDDNGRFCKECSFRPWAASTAGPVAVAVETGSVVHDAVPEGEFWLADVNLLPGQVATITVSYADGRVGRPHVYTAPAVEPPVPPPPAEPDPQGIAGCLLTQDPALCQAAALSLQGLQDCSFDESGFNCAYEVLADAISIETAAEFVRSLAGQCAASPVAPVCGILRSGGNGALPDRVGVASRMIARGDLQYAEAGAVPPSAKGVDGAIDDWMAQGTRFGGTDIHEFGEHVYTDFVFDAFGADDGDDARRLAALAALGDFSDRTGRIDALQQAGGDQLDVPPPAGSTADHYGDAANREDGTDLTELRWGADRSDLFLLARVARLENPASLVVVVLADQFDGEAGLTGLDAGLGTAIFDRAIVLRDGGGQIFNSAVGGAPVPLETTVSAAGYDNALEARIPRAYIERPDGSIRVAVFTARVAGGSLVPANVAYRHDEPVTIYSERAQALALFGGSVDPFARSIKVADLEGGRTQTARPGPGYHERQFVSGGNISVEGDSENGRLQPYGLFVPATIRLNAQNQARLTFWTHYRGGKAHSGAAWTPRLFTQLGEEQGNLVVSPRARGTSTWYTTRAHQDFFEVFADVAGTRRLNQYADENLPAGHAFTATGLFDVDPARIYISGYSMGGYATYLFGGLYPDLFAGGYSTSGAVTQGAWTGVGPNPGDPGHDDTCGMSAPDSFPEVGGSSPCFIEANNGRANAQLNYRLLENTRYVPLVIHHGSNDELALTPGAERMGQRLLELQYRYDMTTFLGYEHFTQAIVDEWADGARYLNLHQRPENPRLVTYQVVPALVDAVNEVQLNGVNGNQPFNFHPDGAYWVDDLVVRTVTRDGAGRAAAHESGRIDAESGRLAGASHQAVPRTGTEASAEDPYASTPVASPGQHSTPYLRHSLEWLPTGELAGDANTFAATLANLSHARLDLARMGFAGHFNEAIDGRVSSDGAATLVLAGVGADMTACVNGAAAGEIAMGDDAVVDIAAGDSSVRLLPGFGASCAGTPPVEPEPSPVDSLGAFLEAGAEALVELAQAVVSDPAGAPAAVEDAADTLVAEAGA
ncbi:MAG: hypothetical protein ACRES8_03815, partial [Nevskiaceae bacterium]